LLTLITYGEEFNNVNGAEVKVIKQGYRNAKSKLDFRATSYFELREGSEHTSFVPLVPLEQFKENIMKCLIQKSAPIH
jgi:hypothetical protein